jgi:hypothetical protein
MNTSHEIAAAYAARMDAAAELRALDIAVGNREFTAAETAQEKPASTTRCAAWTT